MADSFKTVAQYNDRFSAELTAEMLRANGIPAGIFGYDSAQPFINAVRPIEVKVNAEDYDEALRLINEDASGEVPGL